MFISSNNSIFNNSINNASTVNGSRSSSSYYNKINTNHVSVCNKITIDVAVLCEEYTTIEKMCHDHIIN